MTLSQRDYKEFFRYWQGRLGDFPNLESLTYRSLLYTGTFAADIAADLQPDAYWTIANASIGLFLFIKSLDDLLDKSTLEAKLTFLKTLKLLPEFKREFRKYLGSEFDKWWTRCVNTSLEAKSARLQGSLDVSRLWEMSAFIALTPYTLLAATQQDLSEVWYQIIQHTFQAKQILDDLCDLAEDLENRSTTPIILELQRHVGTMHWIINLNALAIDRLREAHKELTIAIDIATSQGAKAWAHLCSMWLSKVNGFITEFQT